jgi:hypothetical protein
MLQVTIDAAALVGGVCIAALGACVWALRRDPKQSGRAREEAGLTKIRAIAIAQAGGTKLTRSELDLRSRARQAVREVEAGSTLARTVVKINNRKYLRDNPDSSAKDNINS